MSSEQISALIESMVLSSLLSSSQGHFGVDSTRVLCLILTNQIVRAGLVALGAEPQLLAVTKPYPLPSNEDQFSLTVDACLQELDESAESINRTVFCLDDTWADSHDVLPDKKALMEKMLKELGLEALGFVGLNAGLAEALVVLQPAPEFVAITLGKQSLEAEYFSGGKSQGKVISGRSEAVSKDLDQLIQKATPLLPTESPTSYQVCIINTDEAELVAQELMDYTTNCHWPGIDQPPVVNQLDYKTLLDQIMVYATSVWYKKRNEAATANLVTAAKSPPTFSAASPISQKNSHGFRLPFLPIFLGTILGLLTLLGLGWWYLGKNTIFNLSLRLVTQPITKQLNVGLTAANPGKEAYVLASQPIEQELELSASKKTTGTATIGEKAKGKIRLFNKTDQAKTLAAGTQLHTSSGIDFVLDGETTLPAAKVTPSDAGETREYGVVEADATAAAIGDTGNLPAETELTVGVFDRSSYLAKTTAAFTGGTSEQVAKVSQEDIDSLVRDLKKQALTEAEEKWQTTNDSGTYVTPVQNSEVISTVTEPLVDEQADEVKVILKLKVTALSYTAEAIYELADQVLVSLVPSGSELSQQDPQILTKYLSESKYPAIDLELSTTAVPKIYQQELLDQILGHDVTEAINILESKPEIESAELRFDPSLAQWILRKLPQNSQQIKINIQNE